MARPGEPASWTVPAAELGGQVSGRWARARERELGELRACWGARFGSRGVADTRRGERARESEREREGERGCGMAARAAMILQDLVGHTS